MRGFPEAKGQPLGSVGRGGAHETRIVQARLVACAGQHQSVAVGLAAIGQLEEHHDPVPDSESGVTRRDSDQSAPVIATYAGLGGSNDATERVATFTRVGG